MAEVRVSLGDGELERFGAQAEREGMTLSEWLRAAAVKRLEDTQRADYFNSTIKVGAFFEGCDALKRPESEPDWEDHMKVIERSRAGGASDI